MIRFSDHSCTTLIVLFIYVSLCACQSNKREIEGRQVEEPQATSKTYIAPLVHHSRVTVIKVTDRLIALGHENGALSVWRPPLNESAQPLRSWFAHESTVRKVTIEESGILNSLGADGSAAQWTLDAKLLHRERLLDGHPNTALKLSNRMMIFGSDRGVLTAMKSGKRMWRTAGEHGRAVFGLSILDAERVISVGSDGWGRCWRINRGERCGALPLHDGWVTAIQAINDGWVTAGSDGAVKWWSSTLKGDLLRAGVKAEHLQLAIPIAVNLSHTRDITRLETGGGYVVSGSEEGRVVLLQAIVDEKREPQLLKQWSFQSDDLKPVLSLGLDLFRKQLIVGGGPQESLVVLSLKDGQPILKRLFKETQKPNLEVQEKARDHSL